MQNTDWRQGNSRSNAGWHSKNEPNAEALRISFYKSVVTFVLAFAAISQDLIEAEYSAGEVASLNS